MKTELFSLTSSELVFLVSATGTIGIIYSVSRFWARIKRLLDPLLRWWNPPGTYVVMVDDNGRFMDDSARYEYGTYRNRGDAIKVCKWIIKADIEDYLASNRWASPASLYESWSCWGDSPFIIGATFSASTFAKNCAFRLAWRKRILMF